nr:two-component regulator propeller domain-containing protein [Bacteroidia bacterium]
MRKPSLLPVLKLLLLAFLLISSVSRSQSHLSASETNSSAERYHVIIENIRTDAGLTANIISNGIRDHRGFLWTLTPNGVARFDGEDFLDLSRNKNHLQGNNIFTLAEDEKGFIWLLYLIPGTGSASSGKIDLLDTRTLMAQPATEMYPALSKLEGQVLAIFTDPSKNIFLMTNTGNVYKKTEDSDFKLLITLPIQTQGQQKNRVFAGKKYIWVLNNDTTAVCMQHDGKNIHTIKTGKDGYLQPLQLDADENLLVMKGSVSEKKIFPEIFVFTKDGKIIAQGEYLSGKNKVISRIYPIVRSAKQVNGDNILISHPDEGMFLRKKTGEHIQLFGKEEMKLYPDIITSHPLFSDENTCWLFSQTAGLFKITFQPARFTNYLGRSSLPKGLHQEYCQARGIYEDTKNNLYVNSWLGLLISDTKSSSVAIRKLFPNTNGLCINVFDSSIYAFNTGLSAYDPSMNLKYHFHKKNDLSSGNVWSILKTPSGRIWLGTENGLAFTDDISHEIVELQYMNGASGKNQFVYQIITDSDGGLWAATSTGLINFTENGKEVRHYNSNAVSKFKLPLEDIFTIYEDRDKNFWIGTNGNGLVKWNRNTGKTETFTMEEGLSSNVIYGILGEQPLSSQKDVLWMSSTYGLMRFNTATNSINTYTQKDGIAFNEFNRISFYKSKSGTFYFGGIDGVTGFTPSDFINDEQQLNVPLQILSYNQFINQTNTLSDLTGELLQKSEIVMKPGDKFFTLRFRLMNFEKEKPSYAYKFDGYDAGWTYVNENSIRISNLPSGKYTLRIKGQNHQGKWSTSELAIPVTVIAPIYKNPIFLIVSGLAVIICAFAFYRWNTRKLLTEKIRLEMEVAKRTEKIEMQKTELLEMDKLKSRFFANISHELRTPLTLITGPVDAMLHGQYGELNPNLKKALARTEKNGRQLMRFIEQILDLSRLESGKLLIYEKPVVLLSEMHKIESSFKELARTKHQEWKIEYLLPEELIVMMDDDKLEKIIYNLLSNAFKFTPQFGKIIMTIKPLKGSEFDLSNAEKVDIIFEVTDTGKGIPSEDLPYIFDRFFQSAKMDESNTGGSGIGL